MINKILQYSILFFAFILPLSSGLGNLFFFLSLFLWIIEGDFKRKFKVLKKEKIFLIFIAISILTFISALLSNSIHHSFLAGEHKSLIRTIVTHYFAVPFIIAIIITSVNKKIIKLSISAFLIAIFISEITSYLIYFQLLDVNYLKAHHLIYKDATTYNPTPFMNHIEYSVFLSIAILFLIYQFIHTQVKWLKIVILIFIFSATINLFINGGRTGQLIYIVSVTVFTITYFRKNIKMIITSIILIGSIIVFAYYKSSNFQNRVQLAINNMQEISKGNYYNSWGMRAASYKVTINYLLSDPKHFVFGAGAGDSREEYLNYAKQHYSQNIVKSVSHLAHIHNQLLEYWMDGTIFSAILFLTFFYFLIRYPVPVEYKPLLYSFATAVFIASMVDLSLFRQRPAMLFMFLTSYFIILKKIGEK